MPERAGRFEWPGITGVISGNYTIGHGISPSCATLKILPQQLITSVGIGGTTSGFQMNGNLVITDNFGTVVIPGCKVDKIRQVEEGDGFVWYLEILDWRWKWRDAPGTISGQYNQLDPHGKLIPRTIRSPYELAVLCLRAMNVQKYAINMPVGLTQAQGQTHFGLNPPWIGVPDTTGNNPPINWVCERPAQALESLCEQFGRRIIPRLSDYTVTIALPGFGGPLPPGDIAQISPSIDTPEVPAGVAVEGDPTRYQMRLLLEPVGEEWDGSFRPIKRLSYCPTLPSKAQVTTITLSGTVANGYTFQLTVNSTDFGTVTAGPSDTLSDVATNIAAIVPSTNVENVNASSVGNVITFTASETGIPFTVSCTISNTAVTATVQTTTNAQVGGRSWARSAVSPNGFYDAVATTRLTKMQAVALAQKTVFKFYRIADIDVSDQNVGLDANGNESQANTSLATHKINVPGLGEINHRQQLILQPTQVEQVVPTDTDENLRDRNQQPMTINIYNGYSRDKPAAVYGSHRRSNAQYQWVQNGTETGNVRANTPVGSQTFIPFHIDPEQQLVIFSENICYNDIEHGGLNRDPGFVLQTAVLVRDNITNATVCHIASYPQTNDYRGYVVQKRQDVQKNVVGDYTMSTGSVPYPQHNLTGNRVVDFDVTASSDVRANYYLEGMKAQYFANASESRTYHGIVGIDLDGAVQQVTWSIDDQGWASTQASLNTEHSVYVPPYPARRRTEFMRPTEQQNARIHSSAPPRTNTAIDTLARAGSTILSGFRNLFGI